MTTSAHTVYVIPEANFGRFSDDIATLSRKAVRIGCAALVHEVVGSRLITPPKRPGRVQAPSYTVFEVVLDCDVPKVDGYLFAARLDHANETGTIVRAVPNLRFEIPVAYRTAPPACQHCNLARRRRDTFLLRHEESGAFKQVGKTCLHDFFGHDPAKIAKLAELLGYAQECASSASEYDEDSPGHGSRDHRWLSVQRYCSYAAMAVRSHGWVSGSAAYANPELLSTRDTAAGMLWAKKPHILPTAEDQQTASDALAWASSLADKPCPSEYEHNIGVIAQAVVMETRSMGLAASIVGVGIYCF